MCTDTSLLEIPPELDSGPTHLGPEFMTGNFSYFNARRVQDCAFHPGC